MKVFSILIVWSLFNFTNDYSSDSKTDLQAVSVLEKRTELNGIYYRYEIKNVGNTSIAARSYKINFKVNGKTISFDKATEALAPGQSMVYLTQKTLYKKSDDPLHYSLEIQFEDADIDNNKIQGVSVF